MDTFVPKTGHEGQTDFIYCFGVATELLKFGPRLSGSRLLFLIIPGESSSRLTLKMFWKVIFFLDI